MALITLSRGAVAVVDDADYAWLTNGPKWSCDAKNYAVRHVYAVDGRRIMEKMHRLILGAHPNQKVDHKNTDTLDNRRANLRLATVQLNGANRKKQLHYAGKPTKSKFKGVWFDPKRNRWRASIRINGKLQQLGRFLSETKAAEVYDQAATEAWNNYARPNFKSAAPSAGTSQI